MTLHVTFNRAAREEFLGVMAWYESKRSGLALEFMAEIERCISLAAEFPLQFASVGASVRRVIANRFPYSVYFRPEETRIVVLVYSTLRETQPFGQEGLDFALKVKSARFRSSLCCN